jgi:hypothetical protein
MEELPSEMSFDETVVEGEVDVKQLIAELEENRKYSAELLDMLKWNVGILTVVLQEAGGMIEVDQQELESIDLSKTRTEISFDEERNVYIVKGIFNES